MISNSVYLALTRRRRNPYRLHVAIRHGRQCCQWLIGWKQNYFELAFYEVVLYCRKYVRFIALSDGWLTTWALLDCILQQFYANATSRPRRQIFSDESCDGSLMQLNPIATSPFFLRHQQQNGRSEFTTLRHSIFHVIYSTSIVRERVNYVAHTKFTFW